MLGDKMPFTCSFLFVLIWVTVNFMILTASAATPSCQLKFVEEYKHGTPDKATYAEGQVFSVTTLEGSSVCELPIYDCVSQLDQVVQYLCVGNIKKFTGFQLMCIPTLRIVFTNPNGLHKNITLNTTLLYISCDVSFHDIAVYGRAIGLSNVALFEGSIIDSDRNHSEVKGVSHQPQPQTEVLQVIQGLETLKILYIEDVQFTSLPSVFYDYKWSLMAFLLTNITTSVDEINLLNRSMPYLIVLRLVDASLSGIPDFPWNEADGVTYFDPLKGKLIYGGQSLVMTGNAIHNLSSVHLKGKLHVLSLSFNQIKYLGHDTFSGLTNLELLELNRNLLTKLPDGVFANLKSLKFLLLGDNLITELSPTIFNGLYQLQWLDIGWNQLHRIYRYTFGSLKALTYLILSNNSLLSIGDSAFYNHGHDGLIKTDFPRQLTQISLDNNQLSKVPAWIFCLESARLVNLSRNHLSFEIFERDLVEIDIRRIVSEKKTPKAVIDLRHNKFSLLNITKNEQMKTKLMRILDYWRLDLRDNDLLCECETYSMHQLIKTSRDPAEFSNYNTWVCAVPDEVRGRPMLDIPDDMFMCEKDLEQCPPSCSCFERSADSFITVDCTGKDLTLMPIGVPNGTDTLLLTNNTIGYVDHRGYLGHLKSLELGNNCIKTIAPSVLRLFVHVQKVDLSGNKIETIPAEFSYLKNSQLTLSGNNIQCDCHSVTWIYTHRYTITDVEEVFCNDDGSWLKVLDLANKLDDLCGISKQTLTAISIATGVISTSVIVIMLLVHRFRGEIKLLLYFHLKWHPFDRCDDTDIDNKLYDAFVSYGKDDTLWVINVLRPALENAELPFRLCIHERDFKPGFGITHNILFAVKYSRRMIVVVTQNFVKSGYCSLEFMAAHRKVLKDRTNYLIVILADDVDIEDLDEDLKFYVRTNTYIEYNSQWFWGRLRYAMPQTPISVLRGEEFPEEGYEALFPHPESLMIAQHIQRRRQQILNGEDEIREVVVEEE